VAEEANFDAVPAVRVPLLCRCQVGLQDSCEIIAVFSRFFFDRWYFFASFLRTYSEDIY
jgi:hypothetical protein